MSKMTASANADKPQVLGNAEVCDLLGLERMELKRLRDRGDFPQPLAVLRSGPVWDEREVKQWQTSHK